MDSLLIQIQNKLMKNDAFGCTVALSKDGRTALVGASGYNKCVGTVYVLQKSDSGKWIEKAKLKASDGKAGDRFGSSVALSGDGNRAIVGASKADNRVGAAYIFDITPEGCYESEKFASELSGMASFGGAVALSDDGNVALIGAHGYSDSTGLAFIFACRDDFWMNTAILSSLDGASLDRFGVSVALSGKGDSALIGADRTDGRKGSVYSFIRSESGIWVQQSKIIAEKRRTKSCFGFSISLSTDGKVALIGASGEDDYQGAVYIFKNHNEHWIQQERIVSPVQESGARFGCSVSLSGDANVALIGSDRANKRKGASFMFNMDDTSGVNKIDLLNTTSGDAWGESTALSNDGEVILIGGRNANNKTGSVEFSSKPDTKDEQLDYILEAASISIDDSYEDWTQFEVPAQEITQETCEGVIELGAVAPEDCCCEEVAELESGADVIELGAVAPEDCCCEKVAEPDSVVDVIELGAVLPEASNEERLDFEQVESACEAEVVSLKLTDDITESEAVEAASFVTDVTEDVVEEVSSEAVQSGCLAALELGKSPEAEVSSVAEPEILRGRPVNRISNVHSRYSCVGVRKTDSGVVLSISF